MVSNKRHNIPGSSEASNDPDVWLDGWYPQLAAAQVLAAQMINGNFYKKAGGKDFLLIQAVEDFLAPPEQAG
jgi:hypothetical protein